MTKVRRVVNPRFYVWHFIACKRRQYPFFLGMSNCEAIKSLKDRSQLKTGCWSSYSKPCFTSMSKPDPGNPHPSKKRKHIPEIWNMRTVKGFAKAIKTKTNRANVCCSFGVICHTLTYCLKDQKYRDWFFKAVKQSPQVYTHCGKWLFSVHKWHFVV